MAPRRSASVSGCGASSTRWRCPRSSCSPHPDTYDQVIIWTDQPILFETFAYQIAIANDIQGIGRAIYDISPDFGSSALRSLVVMGWLGKYSDDTEKKVNGENTTLGLLGHEVGHRWLAFLDFSDHDRQRSSELLGRDHAHWSFFFDTDASVMEGNDIEALGGGAFRTVAAVERYSALDQYAMGLRDESEVPPFFYAEAPANADPPARRTGSPQVGVTFNGTRRDVLIRDIIEGRGPPRPQRRRVAPRPAAGVRLCRPGRARAQSRPRRQARPDPAAVGDVLPRGDGRSHDGRNPVASAGGGRDLRSLIRERRRTSGRRRTSPGPTEPSPGDSQCASRDRRSRSSGELGSAAKPACRTWTASAGWDKRS